MLSAEESDQKELSRDRVPKRPVTCSMSLFLKAPEERYSKYHHSEQRGLIV